MSQAGELITHGEANLHEPKGKIQLETSSIRPNFRPIPAISRALPREEVLKKSEEIMSLNIAAYSEIYDSDLTFLIAASLRKMLTEMPERSVFNCLFDPTGNSLIGYMWAEPHIGDYTDEITRLVPHSDDIALIVSTALLPEYQKQGLVQILGTSMDDELRKLDFKKVVRTPTCSNDYALKIVKNLGDKMLLNEPFKSDGLGPQRLILSRLD